MHKKYHVLCNRCLAFLTALCLMLLSINSNMLVSYASAPDNSYKIGDDVMAVLSESGVLSISGAGDTYDYKNEEGSRTPFYDKRMLITGIEIGEDVTSVGNYLLYNCSNLSGTLSLPASVDRIGERAFSGESAEEAPSFTYVHNQFVETDIIAEDIVRTAPEMEPEVPVGSEGDAAPQPLLEEKTQESIQHITQQEIGEEIFYPGQIGVFENVEPHNASFYNAAVNAGYAQVLSWKSLLFADGFGNSIENMVPVTEAGIFLPEYEETGLAFPESAQGEYYLQGWSSELAGGEILEPHSFCSLEAGNMTAQWKMQFAALKQQSISATVGKQEIEVRGNLPEGAEITARTVELTDELLGLVSQAVGSEKPEVLFALDITISAGGAEYQPNEYNESVSVHIRNPENQPTDNLKVIHLAENEQTKQLDVVETLAPQNTADNSVEFTAESFSLYVGAKAEGIVYQANDYSAEYTGELHTFEVKVSSPDGAKVEYSIDNSAAYSETPPTMTNVGTETVYWKITAEGFQDVNGHNSFSVLKGKNEWIDTLTCPDIQYGTTPKPLAKAKWGTTTYSYYQDSSDVSSLQDIPNDLGTYYVKASVAGDDNYESLESELVSFTITNTVIYAASGKNLQRIDTQQGIQNFNQVTTQANGDFTIFYGFQYNPDSINKPLTIEFSKAMPEGTKLTMLDISQSHESLPKFFYYSVPQGGLTSIESTFFYKMGTTEQKSFEHVEDGIGDVQVQYQLCVEFPENAADTSELTVALKQNDTELSETKVTVFRTGSSEVSPALTLFDTAGGDKNITATANVTNAQDNILAVTLLDINGNAAAFPVGSSVTMGDNNLIPYAQRDSFAVFTDISTGSYPIFVTGLGAGSYKLKIDLCLSSTDTSIQAYPLANSVDSKETGVLTVTAFEYAIKAELTEEKKRVVSSAEETKLGFNVTCSSVSTAKLSVTVQKKTDGEYIDLVPDSQWSVTGTETVHNGSGNVSITVPGKTQPGTYRLVFKLGDAQFPYNIIVK